MAVKGDLQLSADGRQILLTSGARMAEQQIRVGSQIWTGTIAWDPDAGLPMLGTILVKGPDFRVLSQIFESFFLSKSGVQSIDELSVSLDSAARKLKVQFAGTAEDGASISDEVSFAVA